MKLFKIAAALLLLTALPGCAAFDQLSRVGTAPTLSAIEDPTAQKGYRPVQMPMPVVQPASYEPNSLFSTDARGFFKDQRAHKVGDILTVLVTIDDSAQISNATSRQRSSENTGSLGSVLGGAVGGKVPLVDVDATGSLKTGSDMTDGGTGTVNRKESVVTSVAVVVTQTLPNGNLVIEGHQEVRVNFEIRDLIVAGVVRPEDIGSDNTIPSSKIAEARISYGGRGQITDVQQPRYGQQIADAILPF